MCMLCGEFEKGRLSLEEAWKNFDEMVESLENKHIIEVMEKLYSAEEGEDNVQQAP